MKQDDQENFLLIEVSLNRSDRNNWQNRIISPLPLPWKSRQKARADKNSLSADFECYQPSFVERKTTKEPRGTRLAMSLSPARKPPKNRRKKLQSRRRFLCLKKQKRKER